MDAKDHETEQAEDQDAVIIFRRIMRDSPPHWRPKAHWYVEFHDVAADRGFPSGIAFISVFFGCAYLNYIFVVDQERRRGCATALLEACLKKWPSLALGEGVSRAGRRLLRKVNAQLPERAVCQRCGKEYPPGQNCAHCWDRGYYRYIRALERVKGRGRRPRRQQSA